MESGCTGWGLALRLEAGMYRQFMKPEVNVRDLARALDHAHEVLDLPWELQAAMVDVFLDDPKPYMRSRKATPWREFIAHGLTIADAARELLAETTQGQRVLAIEENWRQQRAREVQAQEARAREEAYQARLDNDPAFAADEAAEEKIRRDEMVAHLAAEAEQARQEAEQLRLREEALAEQRAQEAASAEQAQAREDAEAEQRSQRHEARRLKSAQLEAQREIAATEVSAQRRKKRAEDRAERAKRAPSDPSRPNYVPTYDEIKARTAPRP